MLIAGLGGFVGTCLRFLTGKIFHFAGAEAFPWGTFTVNLIGSFVIGIFFGMAEKTHLISPSMNVFLITGFCGGFTTFSTLMNESFLLLKEGNFSAFFLYTLISFAGGLLAIGLGYLAARETEYTNIRILLMGRGAGLPADVIRSRLRNGYV